MFPAARRRAGLVLLALICVARVADAQSGEAGSSSRPLSAGGEISGTLSTDDPGYFTYTDYDQDLLRQLRVRLMGEWRPVSALAFVAEVRSLNVDEVEAAAWYARWQPWRSHDFAIQAGRIPPVIGSFPRRSYGRDNPLLSAPLAYQYTTSLRSDAVASSTDDILAMRGRGWRPSYPIGSTDAAAGNPLVSSTHWSTGVEAYWRTGWFETAGAFGLGSPAAPLAIGRYRGHQWSGRAGVSLPSGLIAGVSAARGRWLDDDVLDLVGGNAREHDDQTLLGADVEYGRGPWLFRGEWIHTVFRIPLTASPSTTRLPAWSGFGDVRYRIAPRWQVAGRLDHLGFGTITGTVEPITDTWDADVTRLEGVIAYRITRQVEVRGGWLQHWRDGGAVRRRGAPAASVLFWF